MPPFQFIKADIANAIQNAQRQSKIPSFFAGVPTLKASTSTASTDSSGSPAKKKSKPTDCINEKIASVISVSAKRDEAKEEVASVISVSAKSDKAKEVASMISGSAKSDEAEEEGLAYLVLKSLPKTRRRVKCLLQIRPG